MQSKLFRLPASHGDDLQALRERISELDEQVTNLKHLDDAIRRNNGLFEALLAASHDGIVLTRHDATILRVIKSILGYETAIVSNLSIYDLVHRDDHGVVHQCYAQLLERRGKQVHHEIRAWKADGTIVWLQGTVTDMLDNPNVQAFVHNYKDITAWKEAETTRLEFAAVIEHIPFAVFSKDANGIIQSWNRGAERAFGYSNAEMIGQSVSILIPAEFQCEEREIRALVIQHGKSFGPVRTMRLHKIGSLLPLDLTLTPIVRDGSVRGVIHTSKQTLA